MHIYIDVVDCAVFSMLLVVVSFIDFCFSLVYLRQISRLECSQWRNELGPDPQVY